MAAIEINENVVESTITLCEFLTQGPAEAICSLLHVVALMSNMKSAAKPGSSPQDREAELHAILGQCLTYVQEQAAP